MSSVSYSVFWLPFLTAHCKSIKGGGSSLSEAVWVPQEDYMLQSHDVAGGFKAMNDHLVSLFILLQ